MNIIGQSILLRALAPEDNAMLLCLLNDPETEFFLGGAAFPQSAQAQAAWLAAQGNAAATLRCAIVPAQQQAAVGTVILSDIDYRNGTAQLHLKLLPEARGKGYGTDAVRSICGYAFRELRLYCVYATINEYNAGSRRLFARCGFLEEGVLRGRVFKRGCHQQQISVSLLSGEYAASIE